MDDVGQWPTTAVVFGASGGIGRALTKILADRGATTVYAGSRSGDVPDHEAITPFRFDLEDAGSLESIAKELADQPPELAIVATGVLTLATGAGPEKSLRHIDAETMEQVLRLNTVGPALIARHILPLLPRDRRAVFAALSARVGSISDNHLGGWHSYRASKAALNMLLRNFAIELKRTHDRAVVVGLHPGTVDTKLSEPFQANVPDGQLAIPKDAAGRLLDVISRLESKDSGNVFDWKGEEIPA